MSEVYPDKTVRMVLVFHKSSCSVVDFDKAFVAGAGLVEDIWFVARQAG